MRLLWAMILSFWESAAAAEYVRGDFLAANTRFGLLQVAGEIGAQTLLFNGTDLGVSDHSFSIEGVWAVDGGQSDWAVVAARHGGNMCGGFELILLKLSATQVSRTDRFGVCRGAPIAIRPEADAVELDVSDPEPFVSHRVFRFDGVSLQETSVAEGAAEVSTEDPSRWLGQHPLSMTQDPGEQARFLRHMSQADFQELSRRLSGPGATEQQGDWIVGKACQAHQCNAFGAAWAIRRSDGAALVVFYDGPNVSQVLAGDQQLSGPVVKQLLGGR